MLWYKIIIIVVLIHNNHILVPSFSNLPLKPISAQFKNAWKSPITTEQNFTTNHLKILEITYFPNISIHVHRPTSRNYIIV